LGSGAATGATATATAYPIRVRLALAGNVPTTVVRSPMSASVYFGIGTTVDIETFGAPLAPMWLGLDFASPTLNGRLPWITPAVFGQGWVAPGPALVVTPLSFLPATGPYLTSLPLPAIASFRGMTLVLQSVVVDPVLGLSWSSATDLTVN
jgi:hypothetical protein